MECYVGQIVLFPYNFVPYGWLKCDGTALNIRQYQALFALISNRFGGDGQNTFCVPNLLGAEPIPNMNYYIAYTGIYPSRD